MVLYERRKSMDEKEQPQFCAVSPLDLKPFEFRCNAISNLATEKSTCCIVILMQEKGSWESFSFAEINEVYHKLHFGKVPTKNFSFNNLLGDYHEIICGKPCLKHGNLIIAEEGNNSNYFDDRDTFRVNDRFVGLAFNSQRFAQYPEISRLILNFHS